MLTCRRQVEDEGAYLGCVRPCRLEGWLNDLRWCGLRPPPLPLPLPVAEPLHVRELAEPEPEPESAEEVDMAEER